MWSFQLALRSRGLGSAWTTLHLNFEREVGEILGIPDTVTQVALLPVAYYTGEDFKPARAVPSRRSPTGTGGRPLGRPRTDGSTTMHLSMLLDMAADGFGDRVAVGSRTAV